LDYRRDHRKEELKRLNKRLPLKKSGKRLG